MSLSLPVPEVLPDLSPIPGLQSLGRRLYRGASLLILVGLLLLVLSGLNSPAQAWGNVLVAGYNLTGVGLGALVLLAVQALTSARWGDPILAPLHALPKVLPYAAVLMLALWFGAHHIYPWAMPEWAHNHHVHGRHSWLNAPFFFARIALFFGLWIFLGRALLAKHRLAAPFLAVFAATFALASFDWIMSVQPLWYSTIFAIYGFAGMFVQSIALLTLSAIALRHFGLVTRVADARNHDLGKLLFAFSCFWAYIWLSQFLLIWYSNIPEEIAPVKAVLFGEWAPVFYLNLVLNFVLPFALLLPKKAKQNETVLLWAIVILAAGHWLDLYLLVFPPLTKGAAPTFGLPELGGILLTLGIGHLAVWSRLTRARPTVWNEGYATGADLFDAQHKGLLDKVNEIYGLLENYRPGHEKQIETAFTAFAEMVRSHVRTEEAYLAAGGHTMAKEHAKLHHAFQLELDRLVGRRDFTAETHPALLAALAHFRFHFDTEEEQALLQRLRPAGTPAQPLEGP